MRAVSRSCAVTREVMPVEDLIRFVRAPDGSVVPDVKRRLPGRGVWVEARAARVAEAVKKRIFSRGFKDQVTVRPDLAEEVGSLLERAALDMLSMANKAGKVVSGYGKVETALKRGEALIVLHARDGAEDGRRKIAQVARRAGKDGGPVPVIEPFVSGQMDLALGRENVIHAALLAAPVSDAFVARANELARYRNGEPGKPAGTDVE